MIKVVAVLLIASLAAATSPVPQMSKAELWSEAVAKFITDPHFYRQIPLNETKNRYLPLLSGDQLTFPGGSGSGYGSNTDMGILFAFTNLRTLDKSENVKIRREGIESILLVLPSTDPEGHEVYPLMKAKLLHRLPKPLWNMKFEDKSYFWRRGKSHYTVNLDFNDFSAPEAKLPGAGPYVIVQAGYEEGDSEEP